MKKKTLFFLCLVFLQFQNVFAASDLRTDSISYLKIAELEYKDGQLFLTEQVKPADQEDYKPYKLTLSNQEAEQFLQLVKEVKLLDIQSHDSKGAPLSVEIEFVKNGKPGKISTCNNGMSETEKAAFDSYLKEVSRIINRHNHIKALLTTFPDGEYRVKDWKRYQVYIAKGWIPWEKKEDTVKQANLPLYVLNGKVIDSEKNVLSDIAPQDIESLEVLKNAEMIKTYGDQAKHGVVLITTKKK